MSRWRAAVKVEDQCWEAAVIPTTAVPTTTIPTRVVKFEEIYLKFKKFEKVQDNNKVQKGSHPHPITNVTGRRSVFSIL